MTSINLQLIHWACFRSAVVLSSHFRSWDRITPQNWHDSTGFTWVSPSLMEGVRTAPYLKFTTISTVFPDWAAGCCYCTSAVSARVPFDRLIHPHWRCGQPGWCRQWTIQLVYREKSSGDSMQPCGEPMQVDLELEMSFTRWALRADTQEWMRIVLKAELQSRNKILAKLLGVSRCFRTYSLRRQCICWPYWQTAAGPVPNQWFVLDGPGPGTPGPSWPPRSRRLVSFKSENRNNDCRLEACRDVTQYQRGVKDIGENAGAVLYESRGDRVRACCLSPHLLISASFGSSTVSSVTIPSSTHERLSLPLTVTYTKWTTDISFCILYFLNSHGNTQTFI